MAKWCQVGAVLVSCPIGESAREPRSPKGQGSWHGTECDSPVPEGDILVPRLGIALCHRTS